ncbi:hypothetical protein OSB04_001609 [Centaurea solstitialis]|uniref:TTF-type domain-containing protein n=1 Tax=Centaurea solstitialis TaxID=347529 RepID=A0AA38UA65_9ASTR|nr:hypothetical protein OSB04_001609 [Centaurea solstitialis]
MLRFFKYIGESSSNDIPKDTNVEETVDKDNEQETPLKYIKVDLDSLAGDLRQRPSMEVYHVNQRDEIKRHYLQKGPCQPRKHSFERREIGGRVRKFNPSWFDDHKYLSEYSIKLEAAFCLCCYLFKTDLKNQGGEDNFVKCGFEAWNKRECLDLHSNGGSHNLAVQKCQNVMNQAQSIATIFDKQTDSTKDKNRLRYMLLLTVLDSYYVKGYLFVVIMKEVTQETKLQLALVFIAKNHHDINDFFELTSRLLNMIGSSYKRHDKLRDKQATRVVVALADGELESGTGLNQEIGIKRPSDTRWGSHYGSLLNIKTLYPSICEVLEDIMEDANSQDHRSEARRMLKSILTFDFVFYLHLLVDILGITNELSTTLQRKDKDIINAMNQVSNSYHYQVDVFYSVIDMQLQELINHFNEANTTLLLSIASLCARQSFRSFQVDELMKMVEFYPVEFPTTELEALRGQLQNYTKDVHGDARFNDLKGLGDLAKQMVETNKYQIYPKVYVLLKLALTFPVATSTVERAFSAMKLKE